MKKLIVLLCVGLCLLSLTGCESKVTIQNMDDLTLYNETLDIGISIGMTREKASEVLGEELQEIGTFLDNGLFVYLQDDKVIGLTAYDSDWCFRGGIRPGGGADEIESFMKEGTIEKIMDTRTEYWNYYNEKRQLTSEDKSAYCAYIIVIENEIRDIVCGIWPI